MFNAFIVLVRISDLSFGLVKYPYPKTTHAHIHLFSTNRLNTHLFLLYNQGGGGRKLGGVPYFLILEVGYVFIMVLANIRLIMCVHFTSNITKPKRMSEFFICMPIEKGGGGLRGVVQPNKLFRVCAKPNNLGLTKTAPATISTCCCLVNKY